MESLASIIFLLLIGSLMFLPSVVQSDKCAGKTSTVPLYRAIRDYNKHLYCNYNTDVSPSSERNTSASIAFLMVPRFGYFDDATGVLDLHCYVHTSWTDDRLRPETPLFSPLQEITALELPNDKIWMPDIVAKNLGTYDRKGFKLPYINCEVFMSDGKVLCEYNFRYKLKCKADFTQWPFDRQNCTLEIASWNNGIEDITFSDLQRSLVQMRWFRSTGEWTVTNSRQARENKKSTIFGNKTIQTLMMDFILDRSNNRLSAIFLTPAIILMAMTLTTVWLDPRSIERLSIANLNIVTHLLCIQSLNWTLPHNGNTVPNILRFYHYSFALATLALFLTFLLSKIQATKSLPPKWIAALTAGILRWNVGQILLLCILDPRAAAEIEADADDSGDLVNTGDKQPTWRYIAIFCGWICFIIFVVAYIVMSVTLIPDSAMRPPIEVTNIF